MPNYLKDNYTVNEVNNLLLDEEWPESPFGIDPTGENTVFLLGTVGPNGQQNNTFLDTGPNAITITRNGDVTQGRFSPFSPTGWSAYFDGSGDYLTVASNAAFIFGSGDFTVECWVYASSLPADVMLITKWNAGLTAGTNQWILYLASGVPSFVWSTDGTNASIAATGSTITVNTWNHIAAVRSGNSITVYVNGVGGTAQSVTGSLYTLETEVLGISYRRNNGSTNNPLTGYISNLRILKGTALYTANFTPSTTALTTVSNTALLTLRDPVLADDSPNNVTITRNGDARLTTFSPFNTTPYTLTANSHSVYFDGTGDGLVTTTNSTTPVAGDFTWETWVYFNSLATSQCLIAISLVASSASTLLYYDTTTGIRYAAARSGTDVISIQQGSITGWSTGQWYHVALVRNGNTYTIYRNGVSVATGISTAIPSTLTQPISLAYRVYTSSELYLNGYLSNIRIVNGTALYTANFTPATTALTSVANTSLLTCQSTTIRDNSTNNFAITVNGDARPSTVNPFGETATAIANYSWSANSYSASGYFDGTGDYLTLSSGAPFAPGTGDWTWEAWFYTSAVMPTNCYFILVDTASTGLYIGYDTAGTFVLAGRRATAADNAVLYTMPLNQWVHLAVSRQGSTIRFFENGVLRHSGSNSTNYSGTGTTYLFGGLAGSVVLPAGYVSNFRFVKGTALYTGPFIPATTPLTTVANTSILTLQSDIGSNSGQFVDQSNHTQMMSRSNNASQGSFGPLIPASWSAYFDGSGDYLSIPYSSTSLNLSTGNFTIECWAYTNGGIWFTTYMNSGIGIAITGSVYYLSSDGSTWNIANGVSIGSWTNNQWNHFAFVRNGNVFTPYVNGVAGTSTTSAAALNMGGQNFGIGNNSQGFTGPIGYLSNFRIVKGTAVYTANFTPSTTTLSSVTNTSLLTLTRPTLLDVGPNRFAITRNGDVRVTPFGPFGPHTVTTRGYSVYFDGTGDYLTVPSNSAFDFGTGDLTLECWMYLTASIGANGIILIDKRAGSGQALWITGLSSTGTLFYSNNSTTVYSSNSVTTNTWAHLAWVRTSGVLKMFINGIEGYSAANTDNMTTANPLTIGGHVGGTAGYFLTGYLSNLRILKGTALYTTTFTPSTQTLTAVANTSLLTAHTSTLSDGSTNNFTVTATGDATTASFNPWGSDTALGVSYDPAVHGGSVYFDGTTDTVQTVSTSLGSIAFRTNDWTIDFWLYPISHDGDYDAYCAVGVMNIGYYPGTARGTVFVLSDGSGWPGMYKITSSVAPTIGQWNHLAASKRSGTVRLFLNGRLLGTYSDSYNHGPGQIVIGGSGAAAGAYQPNCYIANFRVLNGTALYTSNFELPDSVPTVTANTAFLSTFTNSGITDSAYRTVLESVGDARVTTAVKKYNTGSLSFDGTGDYMYVSNSDANLAFGTGDFTIEFWIYPATAGQTATIIDWRPSNTNGAYPMLYLSSGSIKMYVNTGDQISGGTVTASTWSHIALARSSGVTKLFLNGTQTGSNYTDTNSYLVGVSRPMVGSNGFDLLIPFNGYIDDLRVTKGYARYTANFTVPSGAFVRI